MKAGDIARLYSKATNTGKYQYLGNGVLIRKIGTYEGYWEVKHDDGMTMRLFIEPEHLIKSPSKKPLLRLV